MSIISRLISFIPRKIALYRKEQHERELEAKYCNLTKYRISDSRIHVGEFTYGIPNIAEYSSSWTLEIGKFCSIADGVLIVFGGQHHHDYISQYAFNRVVQEYFDNYKYSDKPTEPVIIGNDVWIGRNVTILQGVTIGDGAVLGTNTVVAKDIPPYAIVVGNPARIIKYRFTHNQIEALQRIQWWNWPADKIKDNISDIMSPDIDSFIQKFDSK